MAETDYKVVYKSRGGPRDSDRPERDRRPHANDTYKNPYAESATSRTKSARYRDSSSTIDSESTLTASRTTKTTYPVRERSKEVYVDVRQSRTEQDHDSRGNRDRRTRSIAVLDQESPPDRSPRDSGSLRNEQQPRSRNAVNKEVDRPRERRSDYVLDDTVRKEDGAYYIDTRGEVEIIMPGRDDPRVRDGRGPEYVYKNASSAQRRQYYDEHDFREGDTLPGGVVVLRRDITPPFQSRSQYRPNERPSAREYEEVDDDWRLVEDMRETRVSSAHPRESRARSKAPTQSSEGSFVIVSPEESQAQPGLRSALRQPDYDPREVRRRRSRSISFRDKEVSNHDASESRHERPGAEAANCGRYLQGRSKDEHDTYDRRRMSEVPTRDERRRQQSDAVMDYSYEDRIWAPYPPQQDQPSRRRSRSRRRKREEDDDKRSYFSEHKFYKKETRYL